VLAELFKAAIIVVSDIGVRLPQLLGNFAEGISLKEMQPQSLSLLSGQSLQNFSPTVPPEKSFDSLVVFCARIWPRFSLWELVRNSGQIESVRLEVPSAQKGLRIGYLNDPGTRRAFCAIEQNAFLVDVEEYLLDKIIRL
jgi:hypothetical protein